MPDDYPPDSSTTGIVHVGDSATGAIETRGDTDWFKVRLQAGKTYRIDLEGAATGAGTLPDPDLLGIYSTREVLLPGTGDDDAGAGLNSRVLFTPDRYGDVYIGVAAQGHGAGTYKLLVTDAGADDYPAGETGVLDIGGQAQGEIELPGDTDRFAIRLEAGRTYRLDLDGPPVNAGRVFDLRDAGGNPAARVERDGANRLFVRPGEDGDYTVAVGGAQDSIRHTGRYTLTAEDVTRADDVPRGGAAALTVGQPVAGEIERPGDTDRFAVTLAAGTLYRVDVRGSETGQGTLADPYLLGIYRDDGHGGASERFADTADNDSGAGRDSLLLFRAPDAGQYQVVLGASQGAGTGTYALAVTEMVEQGADPGTTGAVAVGGRAGGAVESGADADWFAVELDAGIEYRIEVRGNTDNAYGGSLYNPNLTLYDARGAALEAVAAGNGSGKLGFNAALAFEADETGTYFIGVEGGGRTGSYTVYVNRFTDEYGTSILNSGTVAVGGASTGDIGEPRDRDRFAVELEAGRAYRIDLEGAPTDRGTLTDPYLRGIYFNRALLPGAADDDGGTGLNSRVDFLAPETGIYYIDAGAYSDRTGSYRLSVQEVTDDIPASSDTDAAVAVDGSATGSVEYGGDVDWFAVSLSAGSHIRIDLAGTSTGQGSLEDPVLYGIYDAAGETVAAGNDDGGEGYNSRLEFIAPATTTYYIAAGARAAHTGSYRLSVDEVADDYPASTATGAAVTVGGSSTGTIERPGDADWFVVELIEGSEYRIDLEGWRTDRGSLEDPYLLGIHDLDGELIPGTANDDGGNGLNSRVVFEAAYTGVYYIAAGAFEDYTGGYTLSVVDVL